MIILNFIKNCEKYSKSIETAAGKREIAHYEQFLLFPEFSKELYSKQTDM